MPPATVSKRTFKSPYWDVPPVGYENVTPREYKAMQAAGQVPHSVVNPSSQILQASKFAHPDPLAAAKAAAKAINELLTKQGLLDPSAIRQDSGNNNSSGDNKNANLTRQARRLYVGNIPFSFSDNEMIDFFQTNMTERGLLSQPGCPVLNCQINTNKNFAFIEFRTVEEASWAISLDGILCKGQPLKIRRPHDYQPIPGSEPAASHDTARSGHGGARSPLSSHHMAPVVIQVPGLANIGTPRVLTEVLCLMNMVEEDELRDDEEYNEILEDIQSECSKYGRVRSIQIPRPPPGDPPADGIGSSSVPGVGKVFVEFDSATEAQRAQVNLAGRRFSDRVVVTSYFDRERYHNKEF